MTVGMAPLAKMADAEKMRKFDQLLSKYPDEFEELVSKLESNPKEVFEFEKLPAEIRNHIYELVYVANGPVQISRHRVTHVEPLDKKSVWRDGEFFLRIQVRGNRIGRQSKFSYAELHSATFLHASKAIYAEALPILYSKNQFVFASRTALHGFKILVGDGWKMLTDVHTKSLDLTGFRGMFALIDLREATRLRSIKLTITKADGKLSGLAKQIAKLIQYSHQCPRNKGQKCGPDLRECSCVTATERKEIFQKFDLKFGGDFSVDMEEGGGYQLLSIDTNPGKLNNAVLSAWQKKIDQEKDNAIDGPEGFKMSDGSVDSLASDA